MKQIAPRIAFEKRHGRHEKVKFPLEVNVRLAVITQDPDVSSA